MNKLILNYYSNKEFCQQILDKTDSDYFTMLYGIFSPNKSTERLCNKYIKKVTEHIKNLGYDFSVSIDGNNWTTLILEGKESDLVHFKLKYM